MAEANEPKVIKVQRIPQKKVTPEDLIATFCYHYQQYTFKQARSLPYKRIIQMLKIANIEHAKQMIDLLQIVSAPHGKKGTVKSIFERFNAIINE